MDEHDKGFFVAEIQSWHALSGCPLCGQNHPCHIHACVLRHPQTSLGDATPIIIVRLICLRTLVERRAGLHRRPYTIRISPQFLGTYTRRSVAIIFKAVGGFLSGVFKDRFEATMALGCKNIKSFARYFDRSLLRIDGWMRHSRKILSKAGAYEEPDLTVSRQRLYHPASYQWQSLVNLCRAIAERHGELGGRVAAWDTEAAVMELVLCAFDPWHGLGPPKARPPPKEGVQGKVDREKM